MEGEEGKCFYGHGGQGLRWMVNGGSRSYAGGDLIGQK